MIFINRIDDFGQKGGFSKIRSAYSNKKYFTCLQRLMWEVKKEAFYFNHFNDKKLVVSLKGVNLRQEPCMHDVNAEVWVEPAIREAGFFYAFILLLMRFDFDSCMKC